MDDGTSQNVPLKPHTASKRIQNGLAQRSNTIRVSAYVCNVNFMIEFANSGARYRLRHVVTISQTMCVLLRSTNMRLVNMDTKLRTANKLLGTRRSEIATGRTSMSRVL